MNAESECEKCWLRYSSYCLGCNNWAIGIGIIGKDEKNEK